MSVEEMPPPSPASKEEHAHPNSMMLGNDKVSKEVSWMMRWQIAYGSWVLRMHHKMNQNIFVPLFLHVADHPYWYLISILLFSISMGTAAFLTGAIEVETSLGKTATPQSSYPVIQEGFVRLISRRRSLNRILIHAEGESVLTYDAVSLAWDVYNVLPAIDHYDEFCDHSILNNVTALRNVNADTNEVAPCSYLSVTLFWANQDAFESEINALVEANSTTKEINDHVRKKLSSHEFADGTLVERELIFGQIETDGVDDSDGELLSARSLAIRLETKGASVEISFGEQIGKLSERQREDPSATVFVEAINVDLRGEELLASLVGDLPLIGAAFIAMALFTAIAMTRWKKNSKGQRFVTSNFLLGIGATVTVLLSTITGYSFCALCGYPLTNITQVLPFVLLGIGLDDAFVLVGAYYDTNPTLPFRARIAAMPTLAAPSITVTTLTDCVAFALGASTSIPGVRWFCFYAVMSILIDFIYQITFFMALLVLDHARSKNGRYDCLICFKAPKTDTNSSNANEEVGASSSAISSQNEGSSLGAVASGSGSIGNGRRRSRSRRMRRLSSVRETPRSTEIMLAYTQFLFHPVTKIVVVLSFFGLLISGAVFASKATVDLDRTDLTPINSQTDFYVNAERDYFFDPDGGRLLVSLYYQDLDVSDPDIREQMRTFRDEMVAYVGVGVSSQPSYWMDDFEDFVVSSNNMDNSSTSFHDEIRAFLQVEPYRSLYREGFFFDGGGNVFAIREPIIVGINLQSVTKQVDFLVTQREITVRQPLNQNLNGQVDRMFMNYVEFPLYEHYRLIPRELTITLVLSVLAVGLVSALFLPHLAGTLLAMLVITCVDVELVGIIYIAGYNINSVTVVLLTMSVGLTADYCLHILHAYFQVDATNRDARSRAALFKIGGSVFLGGFSTFLGVLALAFANGEIFLTFFAMFISMVTLGLGHGLIFLPVVLSYIGPDYVIVHNKSFQRSMRSFRITREESKKSRPPGTESSWFMRNMEVSKVLSSADASGTFSSKSEKRLTKSGTTMTTANKEAVTLSLEEQEEASSTTTKKQGQRTRKSVVRFMDEDLDGIDEMEKAVEKPVETSNE